MIYSALASQDGKVGKRLRSTISFSLLNFCKKILFRSFLSDDFPMFSYVNKLKVFSDLCEPIFSSKYFRSSSIALWITCMLEPAASILSCIGTAATVGESSSKSVFSISILTIIIVSDTYQHNSIKEKGISERCVISRLCCVKVDRIFFER